MPDSTTPPAFPPTPRTRVRRHPERAHYDRETVFAILDAALLAHVGYIIDGRPYVTPTLYWREGDRLYWHGSSASRMLRMQAAGIPVCLTVSHVDGLVLARSAFRHSLNYRAVMAFGTAAPVTDPAEKEAGLNAFVERLYPGRTRLMRPILPQELKATSLLSMLIEDASAKIRDDGPLDLAEDLGAPCWAGVVPIAQRLGAPFPDARAAPPGGAEPEVGHFAEGATFDAVLLALARRYAAG
ncbi:MAG TPA: pyridoxamine 5'-phosphate oxidase family protein [Stellaceae bacterium]|nr:pyridoxamine 5'-phosphate oxidase family protein [Stellaceae bacterium]